MARRHADALLGPGGPTTRPSGVMAVFRVGDDAGEGAPAAGTDATVPAPNRFATSAGTVEGVPATDGLATSGGARVSEASPDKASRSVPVGASTVAHRSPAPLARPRGPASSAGTLGPVAFRIALPPPEPTRPDGLRGHPDLLEAARWFLAHNRPRRPSGFAACRARASFRCENPECGRPTLLLEAHHIHWRRRGGADDPDNAVGLCPSCHVRGVHTRDERIRVTRVVLDGLEARLWEYVERAPVIQFRDLPARPTHPRGVRRTP